MLDLTAKAKEIFEQNKAVGWWDDPNRCIFTTIQLINTEIAEATEGERKNLMDDHLPHRKMGEVELADALIRALDLAGRVGTVFGSKDMERLIASAQLDDDYNRNIAAAHLKLTACVCALYDEIDHHDGYVFSVTANSVMMILVACLIAVATLYDYDIFAAMDEKLAYNKTRLDHKRSERAKANGKAF